MLTRARWIHRVGPWIPLLVALFWSGLALARVGGGESFDSGRSGGDGDDAALGFILQLLIELAIRHPKIGVPLLILFFVAVVWYQKQKGSASTRRALDRVEAERRTQTSSAAVTGWVNALKGRDPAFDLLAFFDRTKRLFLEVQEAWFRRNLEPVRRFLSDATFSRLTVQLKILELQGVRDAIAEGKVLDLQIIGLEQTEFFDTVHVRVKAQLRDEDVPSSSTDEQARAAAMKKAPEQFIEVWSFVRKPGVQTKAGADAFQGACPNCGAPFAGGAANTCEFCKAIVNSGNYDWVLAEITQGSEHAPGNHNIEGLARMRQTDPGFNTETLEDRASLAFWKWVEAQVVGAPALLAKISGPDFLAFLQRDVEALKAAGRRKVFLECAVGAVNSLAVTPVDGVDVAHVEIRWSAKMGVGPANQRPPQLPSVPQRWVFMLQRASGAKTPTGNGMSTSRCPQCNAPLSDNGSPSCEYCGAALATGEKDWVIRDIATWEAWQVQARQAAQGVQPTRAVDRVPDEAERQRLLYLMAAMATADGVVDTKEKALLKMCADRWRVPWASVELALGAGPQLFERLMPRGSPEAESFLRELVSMALVDGKVDRKERHLLEAAAAHLGMTQKLPELLRR